MYNTALKSAPNYHRERRLFLSQMMKDYYLLLGECPGTFEIYVLLVFSTQIGQNFGFD